MSAGITSSSAGVKLFNSLVRASALGAKAGLNKSPMRFVKRNNRAMIEKDANLRERLRGNRANFIFSCLHVSDGYENSAPIRAASTRLQRWGLRMAATNLAKSSSSKP